MEALIGSFAIIAGWLAVAVVILMLMGRHMHHTQPPTDGELYADQVPGAPEENNADPVNITRLPNPGRGDHPHGDDPQRPTRR